jgi:hypothetical protein
MSKVMDVKALPTTYDEERILSHMNEILKIMDKIQPDHGLMSLALDNGYFSVTCDNKGKDMYDKFNFSLHLGVKEPFLMRHSSSGDGYESVPVDIKDVGAYTYDAHRARIMAAAESVRSVK